MKRFIAIALVLICAVSCAGCKKNKHDTSGEYKYDVDIAYYLSVGQIKEAHFSLGTLPREIDEANPDDSHVITGEGNHDHENIISKEEGIVSYHYVYGPFHYYYNKNEADKGISLIVSFDAAYGFSVGSTTKYEVSRVLETIDYKEKTANEDDLFFMPFYIENCEMLVCESGKYKLAFYFVDGTLIATTIENTLNWSAK